MHRMFDQIDTIGPAIIPVQWLMALVKKPSHREKFICLNISSLGFDNQRPAMAAYMQVLFTIDVLENESSSFRHVGAFCDILNIHRTHHNTTVLILNLCAESFYQLLGLTDQLDTMFNEDIRSLFVSQEHMKQHLFTIISYLMNQPEQESIIARYIHDLPSSPQKAILSLFFIKRSAVKKEEVSQLILSIQHGQLWISDFRAQFLALEKTHHLNSSRISQIEKMLDLPLIHYGPLGQTYHHLLEKLEHHIEYILDRFLISFSEEQVNNIVKAMNRGLPLR